MSGARAAGGLRRSLGPVGVILLVISLTSPGGSVLTAGVDIIHQTGGAAILAFLIATPLVLANSVLGAELFGAFPHAGGLYCPVAKIWGAPFATVIMAFVVFAPPGYIALLAVGIVPYLKLVWPWLQDAPTAAAVVAVATGVALLNIRANAWITGVFLTIEIATIALVTVLGAAHPARGFAAAVSLPGPAFAGAPVHSVGLVALALAVVSANWAVSGGTQAVYFSEEMRRPRQLGWVILFAALALAVLEIGPVTGLIVGAHHSGAVLGADSPFMAFLSETLPPWAVGAFSLGAAAALFNAVLAMMVGYARIWYSTGRDGIWPGAISRPLADVHGRLGSPWLATLALGAVSAGVCLLPFHAIVVFSADLGLLNDTVASVSVLIGRRRGLLAHAPYRAPAAPWLGALSVLAFLAALAAQLVDESTGRPGLAVAAGVAVLALVYYALVLRRRNGWSFQEPQGLAAEADPALAQNMEAAQA